MTARDDARLQELLNHDVAPFVAVTPPNDLTATIRISEELITAVCMEEAVSFEMYGDGEEVRFGLRGRDIVSVRQQLEGHYPQAALSIPPVDPIEVRADETVHTAIFKVEGAEQLPIQTFSDEHTFSEGTDPLLGSTANLGGLPRGMRVLVRALASPKPSNWAEQYKRHAQSGAGGSNTAKRDLEQANKSSGRTSGSTLGPLFRFLACIIAALAVLFILMNYGDDVGMILAFIEGLSEIQLLIIFLLAGLVVGAPAIAVLSVIYKHRGPPSPEDSFDDPDLVEQRIYGPGYDFEIQVLVFLRDKSDLGATRASSFVQRLLAQYRRFDHPQGSKFVLHDEFPHLPEAVMDFNFRKHPFWFGRSRVGSMVGLRELAGLWHLPSAENRPHYITKTRLKRLALRPGVLSSGVPVGVTTAGEPRLVRLDEEALGRHWFLAAGTGMGKTTAITHVLRQLMRRKADGLDDTGIVVIDPHSALVDDLLAHVPPEIAHRVRLIDLGNRNHTPGINLLSPRISPFRDAAAECMVKIAASQWPFWGSRMDEILRNSVRTLHSANSNPSVRPENAFTLLDVTRLLDDRDFRQDVLNLVDDSAIPAWWEDGFRTLMSGDRSQTIGPIRNRISAYEGSETARIIFGQPFSTIDLRESIRSGDIVLVATASGRVGDDVASLVGSYLLMMVDEIVRARKENSTEHPHTIVVVDEMQTMAGVEFGKMLSEWRKYRASLVLATQTLTALRAKSDDLVESILTNAGLLSVFNVSAADARDLAPNLSHDLIRAGEITALPPFHSYVRLKLSGRESTTFSMNLLPPVAGRPAIREEIRRRSVRYTQNSEVVWRRLQRRHRDDIGLAH